MLKILVVENDTHLQNTYQATVDEFFKQQVECEYENSRDSALAKLNNPLNNYHGAIVDLRLDSTEIDGSGGNEVLAQIKENLRFPIFVLSGHIGDLDSAFNERTPLFNVREKNTPEGGFANIIEEITAINKTGIINILARNGKIDIYLKEIFWKHLAQTMNYWIAEAQKQNQNTEKALLCYTISHLQEYLEQTEQGDFENYHATEFYISPPIKQHNETVFTADVFKEINSATYYIVLTPSCDLVKRNAATPPKAEFVTLATIIDITTQPNNKRDGLKKDNNQMYHFLPPKKDFYAEGGLVNFGNIRSVSLTDLIDATKFEKVFAITQPFKKDIIARFSHYYARQGQPSLLP